MQVSLATLRASSLVITSGCMTDSLELLIDGKIISSPNTPELKKTFANWVGTVTTKCFYTKETLVQPMQESCFYAGQKFGVRSAQFEAAFKKVQAWVEAKKIESGY